MNVMMLSVSSDNKNCILRGGIRVICNNCKYFKSMKCMSGEKCINFSQHKEVEKSSVEIRLYNHKTGKVLYEDLDMEQLEHILKVLNPEGWQ